MNELIIFELEATAPKKKNELRKINVDLSVLVCSSYSHLLADQINRSMLFI